MRTFEDQDGTPWIATALEEDAARHHGRWYLVIRAKDDDTPVYALPDVRWQSRRSAERTLRTMGEWELQRRLAWVRQRAIEPDGLRLEDVEPQPLLRNLLHRPALRAGD